MIKIQGTKEEKRENIIRKNSNLIAKVLLTLLGFFCMSFYRIQ